MSKLLTSKRIYRLFAAVEAHGGTLRFVGGAVRDTLAGRHNNFDLDLASDLSPDELVEACQDYGIKTIPIGLKFGTVGVIMDMTTGELSFVLDGVNLGVAYHALLAHIFLASLKLGLD